MLRTITIALLVAAVLATAASAAVQPVTIRSLKILVPIYRGADDYPKRFDEPTLAAIKNGCELGRLFYFRNTYGKLNLELTFMPISATAPANDGPTYEHIEADLRARGIKDNQYDGIFTTGIGLNGNWGGFGIFDKTGGAFGGADRRGDLVWYPEDKPDVWYGLGWTFVHEFQHALDSPLAQSSGHPELMSGHPYSDSMEGYFTWGHHAAQQWDWEAHTLRSFADYMAVRGATDSTIQFIDTDGDGLPDDDPRLPMDEKRFGSDPALEDTDGDGLDDMAEFTADIYRGSDPRKVDTDGDGMPDGIDRNPTVPIAAAIAYAAAAPVVDGKMDTCYKQFSFGDYVDNSPELAAARIYAAWNEDALSLFVKSKARCTLNLLIDTSAENGFWEGGDTYPVRVTPDGKVIFCDLGLQGDVPGARAAWGPDGLEVTIPAVIGQGVTHAINWGGKNRPADLTDGMVLLADRSISFNIALSADKQRSLITPNWSMFDTTLQKSPSNPARPSLRFTQRLTGALQPVVRVTGVSPRDRVQVVDAKGRVLGERIGSGSVILTGVLKAGKDASSGANVIVAKSGGSKSTPITLVVDRGADAPAVKITGSNCAIAGEPGSTAEIYAGVGGSPVWPVGSVRLDDKGRGEYALPVGAGFLGSYGLGTDFDSPLFARVDKQINFDYNGDTCDPRLPGDGFCIRWTGTLNVDKPGDYTFYLDTDDGSRMWVDGSKIIENWGHHAPVEKTAAMKLEKGPHEVRVDYYEDYGWASAHLEWSGPSISRTHDIPVRPLPAAVGEPSFFVRQTDPAGNISVFTKL